MPRAAGEVRRMCKDKCSDPDGVRTFPCWSGTSTITGSTGTRKKGRTALRSSTLISATRACRSTFLGLPLGEIAQHVFHGEDVGQAVTIHRGGPTLGCQHTPHEDGACDVLLAASDRDSQCLAGRGPAGATSGRPPRPYGSSSGPLRTPEACRRSQLERPYGRGGLPEVAPAGPRPARHCESRSEAASRTSQAPSSCGVC